jgi:hypothetical protein
MASSEQAEGLKLIADWCKWLVTIETGAIAWLANSIDKPSSNLVAQRSILLSLSSFIVSIIAAGLICSAIPTSVTDIEPEERVMDRRIYLAGRSVGPFWAYTQALFYTFLIGILSFAIGVAVKFVGT